MLSCVPVWAAKEKNDSREINVKEDKRRMQIFMHISQFLA